MDVTHPMLGFSKLLQQRTLLRFEQIFYGKRVKRVLVQVIRE